MSRFLPGDGGLVVTSDGVKTGSDTVRFVNAVAASRPAGVAIIGLGVKAIPGQNPLAAPGTYSA